MDAMDTVVQGHAASPANTSRPGGELLPLTAFTRPHVRFAAPADLLLHFGHGVLTNG